MIFQMTQVQIVACRPILNLSAGTTCVTGTLQLNATTPATGNFTYAWTGPAGFSSTQQNPTRTNANLSHSGTYTCTITDASGQTNTKTVFVQINDCIRSDVNAGIVNQPIPGNVKTNDVVPGGTTYGTPTAVAGNPPGGSITMNSDGTYTFQSPNPGIYTYDVPVCIGGQAAPCPTTRLVITVTQPGANINPPIANTDHATTPLNTAVSVPILTNDGPGNLNGSLGIPTITGGTNAGATATISGGNLVYTPATGFVGKDTVFYQVCESPSGLCAQTSAIITVLPSGAVNTTSASDDYKLTQMNVAASGNVKTNDIDPEGHTTSVTSQTTTVPGKGTLVLNTNGTYTFTPVTGFIGTVDLPYTICDNQTPSACATATLHIVITNAQALSVTFGTISAEYINGSLFVNWTTLTEENNSKFEVEISEDGVNFYKIGEVNTQAPGGNSDAELKYVFERLASEIEFAAIGLFALCLLLPFRRRFKTMAVASILAVSLIYTMSCNKKAADAINEKGKNLYIRIAQIDIDGTKNYSRTVKVIK